MIFTKAAPTNDYEACLADVKERGLEIVKVVTDRPDEHHILCVDRKRINKSGEPTRHRVYFDGPAVSKRADLTPEQQAEQFIAVHVAPAKATKMNRDPSESLELAEQGERMMEEEPDPDLAELEAKRERGRQRFMATRGQTMTTKATYKNLAREGRQAQLADNFRQTLNKCTTREEMEQAASDDPEGYDAFQKWGDAIERGPGHEGDAMQKRLAKSDDLDNKMAKAVNDILERDGCDHREALQKARDENPELFAEWQDA